MTEGSRRRQASSLLALNTTDESIDEAEFAPTELRRMQRRASVDPRIGDDRSRPASLSFNDGPNESFVSRYSAPEVDPLSDQSFVESAASNDPNDSQFVHRRPGSIRYSQGVQTFQVLDYGTDSSFSQNWYTYSRSQSRTQGNSDGRFTVSFLPYSSVVCCYQLSYWHQVFGPKVDHIWMQEPINDGNTDLPPRFECPQIDPRLFRSETQTHICRHTFIGELCRADKEFDIDAMDTKFSIMPDYNICVLSELFYALNNRHPTNYALSIYIIKDKLPRLTAMFPIVQDRLQHLGKKIRHFKRKGYSLSSLECSKWILRSLQFIESIFKAELPVIRLSNTILCDPLVDENEKELLQRAVTSMFQTHSRAIVVGDDEKKINDMIATLALFLTETQRRSASYCDKYTNTFVPDLYLQGLILKGELKTYVSIEAIRTDPQNTSYHRNSDASLPESFGLEQVILSDELVIQSRYPSTIVDIRDRTVWQTRLYPEYRQLRIDFMEANILTTTTLASLYKKSPSTERSRVEESSPLKGTPVDPPISYEQDGLFLRAESLSQWVSSLCDRLSAIQPSMRSAYITSFLRILLRNVMFMIQSLDDTLKECGYKDNPILNVRDRYRIRDMLEVPSDADWDILVSLAESYRPGIYITLKGDPMMIEKKFLEIIDEL